MKLKRDRYYSLLDKIETKMMEFKKKKDGEAIVKLIEDNIESLYIALNEAEQYNENINKNLTPEKLIEKALRLIKTMYVNKVIRTMYIESLKNMLKEKEIA